MSEPNPYEVARATAIERVNRQWSTWIFDKYSDWNGRVLNPNFQDPWYGSNTNTPSHAETLVNAFYAWCWYVYKGYDYYTILALLISNNVENGIQGGLWQAGYHPQETQYETADPSSLTWVTRGGVPVRAVYEVEEVTDPDTGETTWQYVTDLSGNPVIKYAAGSWAALTYSGDALQPTIDATGYGIVQWTPYLVLRFHASMATGADAEYYAPTGQWIIHHHGDGYRYWPLNATLDLMTLEYERGQAMAATAQYGNQYLGEWMNVSAQGVNVVVGMIRYTVQRPVTWDEWASPHALLVEVFGPAAEWESYGVTLEVIVQLLLNIWCSCYLHTSYAGYSITTPLQTFADAIAVWEALGGAKPVYIPRAHSIKDCELDKLHLNPILLGRRKNRPNVRTVLL